MSLIFIIIHKIPKKYSRRKCINSPRALKLRFVSIFFSLFIILSSVGCVFGVFFLHFSLSKAHVWSSNFHSKRIFPSINLIRIRRMSLCVYCDRSLSILWFGKCAEQSNERKITGENHFKGNEKNTNRIAEKIDEKKTNKTNEIQTHTDFIA